MAIVIVIVMVTVMVIGVVIVIVATFGRSLLSLRNETPTDRPTVDA